MVEKRHVIDGLELHYDGIFDLKELLTAIDKYTHERGYGKSEKRRQEIVKEEGKIFSMELRPTKIKTEYYSLMIKIRINITNLEEVEITKGKGKRKTKMNKGNISMLFDAWENTDYMHRWEKKPIFYFLMILANKYWKMFHIGKFQGELVEDTHYIHKNITAFLNLHHY